MGSCGAITCCCKYITISKKRCDREPWDWRRRNGQIKKKRSSKGSRNRNHCHENVPPNPSLTIRCDAVNELSAAIICPQLSAAIVLDIVVLLDVPVFSEPARPDDGAPAYRDVCPDPAAPNDAFPRLASASTTSIVVSVLESELLGLSVVPLKLADVAIGLV